MTVQRNGRRKGGAPRKNPDDAHGPRMDIRWRPKDLVLVQRKAAEAGLCPSAYVREQTLKGRVVVREFNALAPITVHDLNQAILELVAQGNNLNQIAHRCNASGDSHRAEYIRDYIDGHLDPTIKRIRAVLDRHEL